MSTSSSSMPTLSFGPGRKCVVAHFMVGNTYSYRLEDWKEDIELASSHEIDGFALNVGAEDWQKDRVKDCYEAARLVGRGFKLFFSFDMTAIPSRNAEDIFLMRDYIAHYSSHPSQLLWEGKALVSTFSGENSLFGHGNLNDAWTYVREVLEEAFPVHFVPSFFIDPNRYPDLTCMDGYFNWNGSWPIHLKSDSPRQEIECPRLDTDDHHRRTLGGRTFMAAVSPWFFTHYGRDSWNKNWIYRGDDWLFVRRWEQLLQQRDKIDIIQVISWNDYGESHYIGPIKGNQPNSQKWVDGFPHQGWLHLNSVFAASFKKGQASPVITEDRIFMWARPHSKHAVTPDPVPRPDNWELTDDTIWMVIFAAAPATVILSLPPGSSSVSCDVQAGITKLKSDMVPGRTMKAKIVRGGHVVAECAPAYEDFHFQQNPQVYNFNAYVATS